MVTNRLPYSDPEPRRQVQSPIPADRL